MRSWSNVRQGRRAARLVWVFFSIGATLLTVIGVAAAAEPRTVAEIALYQGPDREKILLDGAKREGQLIFYHSWIWPGTVVTREFTKKYPFLKVLPWRGDSTDVLKKTVEEYAAGRSYVDVIETSAPAVLMLQAKGIFQEYYTPEAAFFVNEVKAKGEGGVYYLGHHEDYIGLAFNTQRISPAGAPKSLQDLLDPRWKGRITIAGSSTGIRWLGNALEVMGRDFIEKLSRQEVKVQNISGNALLGLVVSGEVPLTATVFDGGTATARKKGAPVEWRPLEPVVTNIGYSGIPVKAPHPHAAMLFLDYLHSREGQKVLMQGGLNSPREDFGDLRQHFKKAYLENKYKTVEEYEQKFTEWENLLRRFFTKSK